MKKSELKQLIREQLEVAQSQSSDPVDTITMDIPLFIRMLEYAREDATEDEDLHKVTDLAISLTKEMGILTMDDYDSIVGEKRGAAIEKSIASESNDPKEVAWKKFQKDKNVTSKTVKVARRDFEKEYSLMNSNKGLNEDKFKATDSLAEITPAQQRYVDMAANKPSKPKKTQFRKDIEGAKRMIDAGRATNSEIIKKYGIEAFNAVNAENEYLEEDIDLGHQDNEPGMLKGDLYKIGKYSMELYQMMDDLEGQGEVDFPHWWQSKIVTAKNMISGAKHYLDFELKEPQIDAMVDVVSKPLEENTWPKELTSRYSDEYRFELQKVEPTYKDQPGRAKYHVIDIESGELKGTPAFGKVESLMAFADDLIKPQGGTQSTNLGEIDMNDPVLMKMRADKFAGSDPKAGSTIKGKGFNGDKNTARITFLQKERAQLMRDMEQEAEPEGGPIANEYGRKLNRIDAAIAKLSGRKEMTYDQAMAEN